MPNTCHYSSLAILVAVCSTLPRGKATFEFNLNHHSRLTVLLSFYHKCICILLHCQIKVIHSKEAQWLRVQQKRGNIDLLFLTGNTTKDKLMPRGGGWLRCLQCPTSAHAGIHWLYNEMQPVCFQEKRTWSLTHTFRIFYHYCNL